MDSPPSQPRAVEPASDDAEFVDFDCPRCRQPARGRYYGPCARCAQELRSILRGNAEPVATPEYEPKMNVTPNAVATKD